MRSLVVLISIVALAGSVGVVLADDTDVQYDASSDAKTGSTSAHSLSWSTHTVTSEIRRFMAVGISLNHDTTTDPAILVSRVTWTVGGTEQTFGNKQGESSVTGTDAVRAEIWSLTGPNSGSGTVEVTLNNTTVSDEVAYSSAPGVTSVTSESLATGDGSTTAFQNPPVIANLPIVPNTFSITDGTFTGSETGGGVLSGTGITSGNINYDNGQWDITFSTAPASLASITAAYDYGQRSFSGTLSDPGVDPSSVTFSVTIASSTVTITDDGAGMLSGDGGNITGTITYSTGAWTLDFTTPPDASTNITVSYEHQNVADMIAGAVSFYNVNQTNPSTTGTSIDYEASAGTLQWISLTTFDRQAMFGIIATPGNATSLTPLAGQADRWVDDNNGTSSTEVRAAGSTKSTSFSSTAIGWTLGTARKSVLAAINIVPPSTPTEARFAKARAYATQSGTLVSWRTGYEVQNLGFRVYRENEHGERLALNRSLVAGSALFAGPTTKLSVGRSYVFWDGEAGRSARPYWLEAVDLDGSTTLYGPFLSEPVSESDSIKELGGMSLPEARNLSNPPVTRLGRAAPDAAVVVKGFDSGARPVSSRVGLMQQQWQLAKYPAAKILVDQAGWYRVTRAQLAGAGYDPGPIATGLQFFNQGHEEAIRVTGLDDGTFDPDDAIEFYAREIDTPATGVNVYWLTKGVRPGRRVGEVQVSSGTADPAATYAATVTLQDRSLYVAAVTKNGDRDNFYGPVVGSDPLSQVLNVDALASAGGQQPSTLEIALQGITDADHRVAVSFNGHQLDEMEFAGDVSSVRSYAIDASWLQLGGNEVILQALEGDTDVSVTDYLRLTWQRPYQASGDGLEMTVPMGTAVRVSGFSDGTIRLFNVTNRYWPVEIQGTIVQDAGGTWAIEADLSEAESDKVRNLYAVTENRIRTPVGVEANIPSSWHAKNNSADMVVISHSDLLSPAEELAAYRSANGVSSVAVDVEDLYDEFSWGIKDPDAIRAFLAHAASVWSMGPQYVLLMGDASVDPRNYLGFGNLDLVPTNILATIQLKTANDDWFADLDGDGLANLAVGRLPAGTLEQAESMVAKIIGYEQEASAGAWTEKVSLVIDAVTGDFDFGAAADALEGIIPGYIEADRIDLGDVDEATAHGMIVDAFDEGRLLVNYDGHGSQTIWASDDVFESADALNLQNGYDLPFVVAMNCLNGLFQDVYLGSLAEALLVNPNGGAVMVWASSALTDPTGQDMMNRDLYHSLFDGSRPAVGDAVLAAKANVTDQDTRNTWILFGDPSMQLRE